MAELERELAELLDEAPLLPEDDDEGSGVDFVPPPNLAPRPESNPPPPDGATEPVAPVPVVPVPTAAGLVATAPAPVPEAPASRPTPARNEAPDDSEEREPTRAPSAVGKGTLALVTTLVVAAVLVVGRFLTWPSETQQVRQSNSAAASTRHLGPRGGAAPGEGRADATALPLRPSAPPAPSASGDPPAPRLVAESAGPVSAPAFSVVDMLSALAPVAIEAGRCRHTGAPKGRAYVRVTIAAGGNIESVFPGHAYKDSETADCIERKIRSAQLPPFSGAGGSVVLAVDLR